MLEHTELGFFGNIWVRQNNLQNIGEAHAGHKHKFDHVTLLANGSVQVEFEGSEPKTFTAPTFMVIKKDKNHKITALEPDVLYYCVFALRDVNGEVIEDIYSPNNDPIGESAEAVADDYWDKIKDI
jgi:hypothetical protein